MIPKIFHFIWLGSNKPYLKGIERKILLYGSEFKYYLWTDNLELKVEGVETRDINTIGTFNLKFNNNVINNLDTLRSDLYRMRILYKYGGIYSDLDSISVRKLPEEYFKYDFVTCYEKSIVNEDNYSGAIIGFFMCSPYSEALRNLIVLRDTIPYYVSTVKLCLLLGDILNTKILPPETFCPLQITEFPLNTPYAIDLEEMKKIPNCFEVHLYHGNNKEIDFIYNT